MTYCTECGTEVDDSKNFCPECGAEIGTETEVMPEDGGSEEGRDTKKAFVAIFMGILVGAVVAFAFSNLGGSSILFVVTVAGVGYYLYDRKPTARIAVGSGLYILAIWIVLSPILFYIPIIGEANTETAAGAGQAIGGTLGIFIWGFVGLIIALVIGAVGYLIRRGADT